MKLSIVIPIYNEDALIPVLLTRLAKVQRGLCDTFQWTDSDLEWILVNDGSSDRSLELLTKAALTQPSVRVLSLSRNFGHQIAITAGIDHAGGEAVVVMDGDLQDPPEVIASLYEAFLNGHDVVYAIRQKRKGESLFKRGTAALFYKMMRKLTVNTLPVNTGDFRLMSRRVVDILKQMPEKNRFMRGMVSWIGFKQTGVLYERDARYAGKTKYSLPKMMRLALDAITGFSSLPLRLISYMGMGSAFLGFLYSAYVLYLKLYSNHTIQGWSSLVIVVLVLGGIQLICLGMVGEYIGQIHNETKHRPLYIVDSVTSK